MKKDNPHLQSKRRAAAKKMRRFSQAVTRNANKDNESGHIRTPDESICSNEPNIPHSSAAGSEDREQTNPSVILDDKMIQASLNKWCYFQSMFNKK